MQAAQASGLTIQQLQPLKGHQEGAVNTVSLHLMLVGSHAQLTHFVQQIRPYPLVIRDWKIHREADGFLRIQLQCVGFYLPYPEPRANPHDIVLRDPFTVAAVTEAVPTVPTLDNTPVTDIHYVGYLAVGSDVAALVMLPNGITQDVSIGTSVGLEKAKVQRIQMDALTVSTLHHTYRLSRALSPR